MKFSTAASILAFAAAASAIPHGDYEAATSSSEEYHHPAETTSCASESDYYHAEPTETLEYPEPTPEPEYTTEIVTEYTTYCPEATEFTYGTNTYTVTEPTTLTITDCPCTVSVPVYTSTVEACTTCYTPPAETPVYPTEVPVNNATEVAPVETYTPPPPPPATTVAPIETYSNATSPPIATFTGAADKLNVVAGGAFAGVLAFAALLL